MQLVTVIIDGGRSSRFVFNDADNGADRAMQEYYAGGLISGRDLHEALGVLKKEVDTVRGRPEKSRA